MRKNIPLSDCQSIAILLFVVFLVNLPLFALEENAPFFQLDVADHYIAKLDYAAMFLSNPSDFSWGGDTLRGWPVLYGSVIPFHLAAFLNLFLASHSAFLLFAVIHELAAVVGAFWFARLVLKTRSGTALFGSLVYYIQFLYFIENIFVAQITLLPAVAAVVSVRYTKRNLPAVLCLYTCLYLMFYPPYVLPNTFLYHLLCIAMFCPWSRKPMGAALSRFSVFWVGFGLTVWPSLLGFSQHWEDSSRQIWEAVPVSTDWAGAGVHFAKSFVIFSLHPGVLYPTVTIMVLLFIMGWRDATVRRILASTVSVCLVIIVSTAWTQSSLLALSQSALPFVTVFSFIYARLFFLMPFVLFVGVCLLYERVGRSLPSRWTVAIVGGFVAGVVVILLMFHGAGGVLTAALFAVLSSCLMGMYWVFSEHRTIQFRTAFGAAVICIIPLKVAFLAGVSLHGGVSIPFGMVGSDHFSYPSQEQPFRVLSVVDKFAPANFYTAQANIRHMQTLDGGVNVFYSRSAAEQWRDVVKKNETSEDSPQLFRFWTNRAELTQADWQRNTDEILAWARLNNVKLIRSRIRLSHESLRFIGTGEISGFSVRRIVRKWIQAIGSDLDGSFGFPFYVYETVSPISRAFGADTTLMKRLEDGQYIDAVRPENLRSMRQISLDEYAPSRFEFRYDNPGDETIMVTENYHAGWALFIDGVAARERLVQGPMGVIQINPPPGAHVYSLRFCPTAGIRFWSGPGLGAVWIIMAQFFMLRYGGARHSSAR